MNEFSLKEDSPVSQSEIEVVGWGRFVRLLVARGVLVVSLSFLMGGDTVQQRDVVVTCDDGEIYQVPASALEAFVTSGCTTQDFDPPPKISSGVNFH